MPDPVLEMPDPIEVVNENLKNALAALADYEPPEKLAYVDNAYRVHYRNIVLRIQHWTDALETLERIYKDVIRIGDSYLSAKENGLATSVIKHRLWRWGDALDEYYSAGRKLGIQRRSIE